MNAWPLQATSKNKCKTRVIDRRPCCCGFSLSFSRPTYVVPAALSRKGLGNAFLLSCFLPCCTSDNREKEHPSQGICRRSHGTAAVAVAAAATGRQSSRSPLICCCIYGCSGKNVAVSQSVTCLPSLSSSLFQGRVPCNLASARCFTSLSLFAVPLRRAHQELSRERKRDGDGGVRQRIGIISSRRRHRRSRTRRGSGSIHRHAAVATASAAA